MGTSYGKKKEALFLLRIKLCLKLSMFVFNKCVGGQLPQCSLEKIGLTVKTEKVFFRQCRRIRRAS